MQINNLHGRSRHEFAYVDCLDPIPLTSRPREGSAVILVEVSNRKERAGVAAISDQTPLPEACAGRIGAFSARHTAGEF